MKYYLSILAFILIGCVSETIAVTPPKPTVLSWDDKPNRKDWSAFLLKKIETNFDLYDKASDASRFCSNYVSLPKIMKIEMWAEVVVWLAFYESSWNPKSSGVDVGTPGNKDTWSTGLLQISVTDQWGELSKMGYKYADLLEPIPNLDLGTGVIQRQLKMRNKMILDNKDKMRYFAVMLQGNRYSKIPQIIANVKKNVEGCK